VTDFRFPFPLPGIFPGGGEPGDRVYRTPDGRPLNEPGRPIDPRDLLGQPPVIDVPNEPPPGVDYPGPDYTQVPNAPPPGEDEPIPYPLEQLPGRIPGVPNLGQQDSGFRYGGYHYEDPEFRGGTRRELERAILRDGARRGQPYWQSCEELGYGGGDSAMEYCDAVVSVEEYDRVRRKAAPPALKLPPGLLQRANPRSLREAGRVPPRASIGSRAQRGASATRVDARTGLPRPGSPLAPSGTRVSLTGLGGLIGREIVRGLPRIFRGVGPGVRREIERMTRQRRTGGLRKAPRMQRSPWSFGTRRGFELPKQPQPVQVPQPPPLEMPTPEPPAFPIPAPSKVPTKVPAPARVPMPSIPLPQPSRTAPRTAPRRRGAPIPRPIPRRQRWPLVGPVPFPLPIPSSRPGRTTWPIGIPLPSLFPSSPLPSVSPPPPAPSPVTSPPTASLPQPVPLTQLQQQGLRFAADQGMPQQRRSRDRDRECRCEKNPPAPSSKVASVKAFRRRMSQHSLDNLRRD